MISGELQQSAERIGLAAVLGLLVGLERFRAGKEAGIRTFALTALAGSLSQLAGEGLYGPLALVLTGIVVAAGAGSALRHGGRPEITTAAALIVTAFLGILIGQGHVFAAVTGAIVTLLLLAWKEEMADFSRHLTREEIHAAVMLLLLGAVILPLLPVAPVDRWGLVNLRQTWIMVVLISAIGFVNYLLYRRFGARGAAYAGFLGGLVNSTATVFQITASAGPQDRAPRSGWILSGILFAKTAMYLRNILVLALFASRALRSALLPLGLMLGVSATLAISRMHRLSGETPELRLQSPFSVRAALEFGVIFLALTVLGGLAHGLLGPAAFYAVATLGGVVSSSTSIAAAAILTHEGVIPPGVAGLGAVLASVGSTVILLLPLLRLPRGTGLLSAAARATVTALAGAAVGLALNATLLGLSPAAW